MKSCEFSNASETLFLLPIGSRVDLSAKRRWRFPRVCLFVPLFVAPWPAVCLFIFFFHFSLVVFVVASCWVVGLFVKQIRAVNCRAKCHRKDRKTRGAAFLLREILPWHNDTVPALPTYIFDCFEEKETMKINNNLTRLSTVFSFNKVKIISSKTSNIN